MSQEVSIATCSDDQGFKVNLTSEKLYVNSVSSQETFALRSINGVGIYDDIDKYNLDLTALKNKQKSKYVLPVIIMIYGVIMILAGFTAGFATSIAGLVLTALGYWWYTVKKRKMENEKPMLDSYFKVMISGNERKFKFNKEQVNSNDIANLTNKIEETLTSYNNG
jgi:hypothetical protein